MPQRRRRSATSGSTAQTSDSATWYTVLGWRCLLAADLGDELGDEINQLVIQPVSSFYEPPVQVRIDIHRHSHPALPFSSCRAPPL